MPVSAASLGEDPEPTMMTMMTLTILVTVMMGRMGLTMRIMNLRRASCFLRVCLLRTCAKSRNCQTYSSPSCRHPLETPIEPFKHLRNPYGNAQRHKKTTNSRSCFTVACLPTRASCMPHSRAPRKCLPSDPKPPKPLSPNPKP